jgi:hypothetical protein
MYFCKLKKQKMKKNTIYLIIAGLLVLASIFVVLHRKNLLNSKDELGPIGAEFAIKDTNNVTRIFMADKRGNSVLLNRTDQGWLVNDTIPALKANVDNLLSTLQNLHIKQIIAKTAQDNIIKMLSSQAVKVEIYQIAPKFSIFGIPFFTKERLVKTYYMGEATMDNMGNYALIEGMDEPYVVNIPGFRGFVTPQFSPYAENWYSHTLFQTKLTRIESVQFLDFENPSESFTIKKTGTRFFTIYNSQNQEIAGYDTTKVLDMLSEFRERNYLSITKNLTQSQQDSVIKNNLFKIIILTDVEGVKSELRFYRLLQLVQEYKDDVAIGDPKLAVNRDNCYGIFNEDYSKLYKLQYYYFDRQLQPLSYFMLQ